MMEITPQRAGRWSWLRQPQPWITLFFSLAFYLLVAGFEGQPIPSWPNQPMMGQTAFVLVCLGMMAAMWYFHEKPWAYYLLTHMFAFGFGAATLLVWQAMPTGPGAVVTDAWFNTAIVIKHRAGMGNSDFAYKGLHSFYPSLYQWIVAQFASLTSTPGLRSMKYGFYWTAFFLPLVSFGLWRKLLPALPAFLMAIAVATLTRINLAFKTFEVISLVVFIPWALYYVAGIRLRIVDGEATWETETLKRRDWIWGGLIAGLCFMTYYYYFFLLIVWVPLQVFVEFRDTGWRGILAKYRPMVLMGLVMMAVSAIYWVPLLGDMLRYGMHSYQNRWFQPHMLGLPFDMFHNWKGILSMLALLALAPSSKLVRGILVMMVALIMYILMGHLGVYRNFPILHVRMLGMEEHLWHVGFILGTLKLLSLVKGFAQSGWEKAAAILFAVIYAMNIAVMYNYEINDDNMKLAKDFKQPELLNIPSFNQLAKEKVFLTNRLDLAALRPMYLWICPNAHYSHPASRYRERVKMLTLLQFSKNPDFIAWMLQHNKYNRVDYLILDDNHLDIYDDNFPYWPNHNPVPIQFDSTAFRGQYFTQHSEFHELIVAEEVPENLWRRFDVGELHLAALFSDIPEIRAEIPEADMKALEDEIRIQTRDYATWKKVFQSRWLQWE